MRLYVGVANVRAKSVLMLTSASPRPTLRSLDHMFPTSVKSGLVSTPTPFLTGRPNTLFYNDRIYETGTVGVALPSASTCEVHSGLEPISSEMVVES